jgi:hypothetical protein
MTGISAHYNMQSKIIRTQVFLFCTENRNTVCNALIKRTVMSNTYGTQVEHKPVLEVEEIRMRSHKVSVFKDHNLPKGCS